MNLEATKIEVPGGICSFRNFAKMMHLPVVGYADFESILKPTRGEKGKGTVQTHEHIPCGFAFHLVSPFLQMEPVVKRAKDETEKTATRIRAGTHFQREKSSPDFAKQEDVSPDKGRVENISRSCSLLALPKRIWGWQSEKSQGSLPFLRKISGSSALSVQLQVSSGQNSPLCFFTICKIMTPIFLFAPWELWTKFWK